MKTYKEIQRSYKDKVLDKLICDLCKKEAVRGSWNNEYAAVTEVNVEYIHGYNYGSDGGSSETLFFDICPECFVNKVIPWFKSMGVEPQKEERDW